jgi:hypothetical protein
MYHILVLWPFPVPLCPSLAISRDLPTCQI